MAGRAHVRRPHRQAAGGLLRPAGPREAHRVRHRPGDAGHPALAARGRRQPAGGQAADDRHRRARQGRRGDGVAHPRPAGREDRERRAHGPHGRGQRRPAARLQAAHDRPHGGPPGIGQDDLRRQAGAPLPIAGPGADARGLRRPPARRRRAAGRARGADRRPGAPRGRDRRRGDRPPRGRGGAQRWARPGHRQHGRPPDDRRRDDGRAGAGARGGRSRPAWCSCSTR